MVAAALSNYRYDWITLTLDTRSGNLVVRCSLAGMPAEAIPFEHDPRTGMFKRLGQGKRGGFKEPMQIDLNFSIPLNQLLRYGFGAADGIRSLRDKQRTGRGNERRDD